MELQTLATDYNIVCITKTRVDSNFYDAWLSLPQNNVTYRKDRNAHGGGVSIGPRLHHTFLDLASDAEITAFKRHSKKLSLCYYRPSVSNSILPFIEYMYNIRQTYPGHSLILIWGSQCVFVHRHPVQTLA